jgi:hypothetical protein
MEKLYKCTKSNMQCIKFQYDFNKTFEIPIKEVKMCESGFHACRTIDDAKLYYKWDQGFRTFEIEGNIIDEENDKVVCNKIRFIKEL